MGWKIQWFIPLYLFLISGAVVRTDRSCVMEEAPLTCGKQAYV